MVLIEGVGDELTFCVIVAVIVILLVAAWQSTFVGDRGRSEPVADIGQHSNVPAPVPSTTARIPPNSTDLETTETVSGESELLSGNEAYGSQQVKHNINEKSPAEPGKNAAVDSPSLSSETSTSAKGKESEPSGDGQENSAPNVSEQEQTAAVPKYTSTAATGNTSTFQESSSAEHKISIKVKFLNDTEREIETALSDTVADIRRKHFARELESNYRVRFIFNGQVLADNNATLEQCGISDNSIIHCLLTAVSDSNANQNSSNRAANYQGFDGEEFELEIGRYVMPILGAILLSLWYFRLEYDEYFNHTSTFSLALLTFIYGVGMYLVWRGALDDGNNTNTVVHPSASDNAQAASHQQATG